MNRKLKTGAKTSICAPVLILDTYSVWLPKNKCHTSTRYTYLQ